MKKVVFLFLSLVILSQIIVPTTAATSSATVNRATTTTTTTVVKYGSEISFEDSDNGIVSIFYNSTSTKKMKLIIQNGTDKEYFNLFSNKETVNYPLVFGEGQYTVSIYENTTGTKYKRLATKTEDVKFKNENTIYLQSVLEINWTEEDESIQLADELLAQALEVKVKPLPSNKKALTTLTEKEIINVLYNYVIENIVYDFEKIKGLDYSYTPDNDKTIEIKTGICYDYSSLLAAMLRSQGVPTKMVKGYANGSETYHAWNEIYLSSEKRWVVVDSTYDAYMEQNNLKYTFEKDAKVYKKVKEF